MQADRSRPPHARPTRPAGWLAFLLVLLPSVLAKAQGVAGTSDAILAPLRGLAASGARVGAVFLRDGREVAAYNGDRDLNPASVSKIFTAAAALQVLGLDHRFPTVVSAVGDGPRVEALLVTPGGDPTLAMPDVEALARCVREKGVRTIGELVVEPGPFTAASEPPAYARKDTLAPYRAGVAAFQVDRGAVTVTISAGAPGGPPNVGLSSTSDRIRVINEAVTGAKAAGGAVVPGRRTAKDGRAGKGGGAARASGRPGRFSLSATVDGEGRLVLRLSGAFTSRTPILQSFRLPDPGAHAAGAFRHALEAAGVEVKGGPPLAAAPTGLHVLCTREGPTLREVLVPMLKDSVNPIAEGVLRSIGAHAAGGRPAGFAEGPRALRAFLKDGVGIPAGSASFTNGSGLYDANRVTARATATLVRWLRRNPGGDVVLAALPIAGVDGTLKKRLKGTPLAGRVRAKTGTLDDAVTLAGLVELPGGKAVEFAVLVNAPECGPSRDPGGRCRALDRFAARKATDEALVQVWKAFGESR